MEQLAKDLQVFLKDFNGCTVEPDGDVIKVYPSDNIATPLFAEFIFAFAFIYSLEYYIGVSIYRRLNFVLYKD